MNYDKEEVAEALRLERKGIAGWLWLALGADFLFGFGPAWLISLLLTVADFQGEILNRALWLWTGSMVGLAIPAVWFGWTSRTRP